MKKNWLIFTVLVFCFLSFNSSTQAATTAECVAGFLCTDTCYHNCDDYNGIVLVSLDCRPGETYTYEATLVVNGLSNTKEINCDPNPPVCTTVLNPSGWAVSTVAEVGTCTDDSSGCDPGSYTTQTIITHGEIASVTAKDYAGNTATCSVSPAAQIDGDPPTCTASLATNNWTNADVVASVVCTDTGASGIASCVIDSPISIADNTFTVTATKTGTATDLAGNTGTCETPPAKIDKIDPTLTTSCISDTKVYPTGFPTGWTNKDVSCTFNLQDVNSQLMAWDVSMSSTGDGADESIANFTATGQNVSTFSNLGSFVAQQDRTYSFGGTIDDNATNRTTLSSSNNFDIKVDKIAPLRLTGGIQLDNGSGVPRELTTTSETFEANEIFTMKLNVSDDFSGMDWSQSGITISGSPSLTKTLFNNLSGGIVFNQGDQTITFNDATSIFETAGDYTIDFEFFDRAGNQMSVTGVVGLKVKVVASEVSTNSTFINNGDQECGVANNVNNCDFTLTLLDRFNNSIFNRGQIVTSFDSQNTDRYGAEGYDLTTQNVAQTFIDGLRFVGGVPSGTSNQFSFTNAATSDQTIAIKSLVPTVDRADGGVGGATQMVVAAKDVILGLSAPGVGFDGSLLGTQSEISLGSTTLEFAPWINASPNGQAGATILDSMSVVFGQPMDIWIYAINNTINLPSNFSVWLKGHPPTSTLFFINEDISTAANGFEKTFSGIASAVANDFVTTKLASFGGVMGDLNMAFSSKVEQEIDGKKVIYSGGVYGDPSLMGLPSIPNPPVLTSYIVGADIEGNILGSGGSVLEQDDDREGVILGENQQMDIRENMNRNAANLIAGRDPIIITGMLSLDVSNLTDGEVSYYKGGTLKLTTPTGKVSGRHTIVIEDGNLFIASDLEYAANNDSLGIILFNSLTSDRVNGNVFLSNTIQNFVGTYFAHGALTSTEKTAADAISPAIATAIDRNPSLTDPLATNNFKKQLILNGTIFTRNTLGGSLLVEMKDPWGSIVADAAEAQKYDLHFIRRYTNIDTAGVDILDADNVNCVKVSTSCDANEHAFVIRPDGKVIDADTVPPGFEYFGTIATN